MRYEYEVAARQIQVAEVTVYYANRDRVYKLKGVTEFSLPWAGQPHSEGAIFSYGQVNELGRQLLTRAVWRMVIWPVRETESRTQRM